MVWGAASQDGNTGTWKEVNRSREGSLEVWLSRFSEPATRQRAGRYVISKNLPPTLDQVFCELLAWEKLDVSALSESTQPQRLRGTIEGNAEVNTGHKQEQTNTNPQERNLSFTAY